MDVRKLSAMASGFLQMASALVAALATAGAASQTRPLEQLSAGQFQAVEATYSALQGRFEKGSATEFELLEAYTAFYQREDRYGEQLGNWIKTYPKSASAFTARGVYYRRLGDSRRGTDYIAKVPPENLRYMDQMHALAVKDLTSALALNPKAYIATLHLLNIAIAAGDDQKALGYLNMANDILPSNLLVQARYFISLAPKWGGSWKEMEKFIKQSQARGASPERIDLLKSLMANEQGLSAFGAGEHAISRDAYARALELSKIGGPWFRNYYLKGALRLCKDPLFSAKEYCS